MKKHIYSILSPVIRTLSVLFIGSSLLLTACGGSSRAAKTAGAAADYPAQAAYEETALSGSPAAAYDYSADSAARNSEKEANPEGDAGTDSSAVQAAAGRKLIKTVNLGLESTDFDLLLQGIQKRVAALGGYIESSWVDGSSMLDSDYTLYGSGNYYGRNASLTLRVPSAKLDGFLTELDGLGNVTSRSEQVEDVTLQYTDIESHKEALNAERERLLALMADAESMDAIIAIQPRLSEIEYELNSYESQLRLYDNQVDYSSIYLDLHEVKSYSATEKATVSTRIQRGLAQNADAFFTALTDLFVGLITGLPFLIPVLLLLYLIFRLLKKLKKKIWKL